MARGEAVPQKETRESIEAELNASKRQRIALQLQDPVITNNVLCGICRLTVIIILIRSGIYSDMGRRS